jgi:hypothetical protein
VVTHPYREIECSCLHKLFGEVSDHFVRDFGVAEVAVMEINLRATPQFSSTLNEGKREELTRRVGRLLGLKVLDDAMIAGTF